MPVRRWGKLLICVFAVACPLASSPAKLAAQEIPLSPERIFVAVTDDDFLEATEPIWCARTLGQSVAECKLRRPGMVFKVDPIRAGAAELLNGDKALPPRPRRLVGLICDGQGRVLSICVGVPNADQLQRLCEDADEVAIALTLDKTFAKARSIVAQRSAGRVTRHYAGLIKPLEPTGAVKPMTELVAMMQPALLADAAERFHIDGFDDAVRWASLQQHAETRRYWCDTMLIAIAGRSVDEIWFDLSAEVWGATPWTRTKIVQQLATECIETLESSPVVLKLNHQAGFLDEKNLLPFAAAVQANRSRDVDDLNVPFYEVDLCQLAVIWTTANAIPISLGVAKDNVAGWVLLDSNEPPALFPFGAENRLARAVQKLQSKNNLQP